MTNRCGSCEKAWCETCLDWPRATLIGDTLPELEALEFGAKEHTYFIRCSSCNGINERPGQEEQLEAESVPRLAKQQGRVGQTRNQISRIYNLISPDTSFSESEWPQSKQHQQRSTRTNSKRKPPVRKPIKKKTRARQVNDFKRSVPAAASDDDILEITPLQWQANKQTLDLKRKGPVDDFEDDTVDIAYNQWQKKKPKLENDKDDWIQLVSD